MTRILSIIFRLRKVVTYLSKIKLYFDKFQFKKYFITVRRNVSYLKVFEEKKS